MASRLEKLISKLKSPAHLFTSKTEIFYLTGVELEGFWLLDTKSGAAVVAPEMLAGQLRGLLPGLEVVSGNDLTETLAGYLRKKGINRLGINGAKASHSFFRKLNRKIILKDDGDILASLRMIKDAEELEAVKSSCRIASAAIKFAEKCIKPGISEEEIAFKIEEFFLKRKARPSFPLIIASGPNSANPHHISSSRKIKPNDVILMDIGCVYKGYCSDLTRTFFLGRTNSLQDKVFAVVKRAQEKALGKVKAGASAASIDRAARELITKAGFGDKFIHTTGHGVGLEIHEPPRLSLKDKTVLKAGMVITVEPGIYLEGAFGVRIEDTAVVTKKGREVFTK